MVLEELDQVVPIEAPMLVALAAVIPVMVEVMVVPVVLLTTIGQEVEVALGATAVMEVVAVLIMA